MNELYALIGGFLTGYSIVATVGIVYLGRRIRELQKECDSLTADLLAREQVDEYDKLALFERADEHDAERFDGME